MGTNTSSPAAYVDHSAGVSGIARMGGAQPRKKTPSKPTKQTTHISNELAASTSTQQQPSIRPSVEPLPPYQPPEHPSGAS